MKELIIFIVGLVTGGVLVWAVKKKDMDLTGINKKRAEQKEQNKQKVIEFITGRDEVVNDDIEKFLGVSNATAERYLNELEQEGRLKQVGKVGRSVKYKALK